MGGGGVGGGVDGGVEGGSGVPGEGGDGGAGGCVGSGAEGPCEGAIGVDGFSPSQPDTKSEIRAIEQTNTPAHRRMFASQQRPYHTQSLVFSSIFSSAGFDG